MNSEKLLDDFDVVFTIVVNKIYIRKNSFSFIGKMYQFALRCLVCIWICGSFGISSAISWGLDLPTSLRIHMPEYLLLAFSGASGHMSLLTELRKSGRASGYLLLNV